MWWAGFTFLLEAPRKSEEAFRAFQGLEGLEGLGVDPSLSVGFRPGRLRRGRRPTAEEKSLSSGLCVFTHSGVCAHSILCVCSHTSSRGPMVWVLQPYAEVPLWRLLPLVVCARAARVWLARDRIFNMVVVLVLIYMLM